MICTEVHEFAKRVLFGETLEDKLATPREINWQMTDRLFDGFALPKEPGREPRLKFSSETIKFPRKASLADKQQKAKALHFFANHELLAIEMLAAALLIFPTHTDEDISFKKTLVATLADEQKHFTLYTDRMNDFGVNFGDFPINNFFWDKMQFVQTRSQFSSLLSLTFESANLDFSLYYSKLFRSLGDESTAKILDEVYKDEIRHVGAGVHWMNQWREDKTLWQYYLENLPELVTPARAKGMEFDTNSRIRAGLDNDFISLLEQYRDEFAITQRREWKNA